MFATFSDGAYPLSPPDPAQPVAGGAGLGPDETALWATVSGFSGILKKGDRVPPGGNGRTSLGNTPTMVAGPNTRMRFGVVGMGDDFHTFHIHGHRWIIPGPDGITPTDIQNSPMVRAVSQFEDTKIFGPANSHVFTIEEGSGFMRASPPNGEWHMHCHVLRHMMMGMMGSLLVVDGGEPALPLPVGVPCGMDTGELQLSRSPISYSTRTTSPSRQVRR